MYRGLGDKLFAVHSRLYLGKGKAVNKEQKSEMRRECIWLVDHLVPSFLCITAIIRL